MESKGRDLFIVDNSVKGWTGIRSRKAILDAVRARAVEVLDSSIESDKPSNPFLQGVPAILEALRARQIECRVYDRDKFHAKAYITHAKLEVVGSQALVGCSNFTAPGLTKNVELDIQVQSAREVAQLQEWFEEHWDDAKDVTELIVETIARHTQLYTPFDVYAKALQESSTRPTTSETQAARQTRSANATPLATIGSSNYWTTASAPRPCSC